MTGMRWKVKQQLRRGEWALAGRTAWWIAQEHWHEWRWGIHSGHADPIAERGADAQENHHYEGMGYAALRRIFARIAPRAEAEQQVLLDAGCGMGRVMIEAARHPYARVLGFDYSRELVATTRANVSRALPRLRCREVQAAWGDASDYTVADAVTTIFIFNSFRGEVMRRFMASVQASLARRPRRLRVVFANPQFFEPAEFPWLRQVGESSHYHPRMGEAARHRLQVLFLETAPAGNA